MSAEDPRTSPASGQRTGISPPAAPAGPGLFGKIPSRGDFVVRRLDPACREALDTWLQAGLLTSRRMLGDDWRRCYLNAPIWHFACPADTCGTAPLAGVLMPSMDRVGRYFPLVLAAQLPPGYHPRGMLDATAWYGALETQALDALERETDLGELDAALEATGPPPPTEGDDQSGKSLFWIPFDGPSSRVLLSTIGLPPAQSFGSMLTQHWPSGGWQPAPGLDRTFFLPLPVKLTAAGRSHAGTRRKLNQDALTLRPDLGLWAVADGVGGHQAGEEASRTVIEHLNQMLPPFELDAALDELAELLTEANTALCARAGTISDDAVVASTVALLLLLDGWAGVLWSGDSRVYRVRAGGLECLTQDHAADGSVHHAVGAEHDLVIGRATHPSWPGDRYLLCSDGLYKSLPEAEVAEHIGLATPEAAVAALIDDALVAGARDNVTAIVVHGPA